MEGFEQSLVWDGRLREVVQIELPYSKSIQNRWLILKHLFPNQVEGEIRADSDDVRLLQEALIHRPAQVDFGMAGTSARFFTAFAGATGWEGVIDGSGRGRERPLGPLLSALRALGASIEELGEPGQFPIRMVSRRLRGGTVAVDSAQSSQFASALMLIGPKLPGGLTLLTGPDPASAPYLDLTARLMNEAGFQVSPFDSGYRIAEASAAPKVPYSAVPERDWSSVVYFVQALVLGCCNALEFIGLQVTGTQPDQAILDQVAGLGVSVESTPVGLAFRQTGLPQTDRRILIDARSWPDLAVGMAHLYQAVGMPVTLEGLGTLDHKESKRLEALRLRLSLHGRAGSPRPDVLELEGGWVRPNRLRFDSLGDHRLAMSCAAWARFGVVHLTDAGSVSKSFPGFWSQLKRLGFDFTNEHPTESE